MTSSLPVFPNRISKSCVQWVAPPSIRKITRKRRVFRQKSRWVGEILRPAAFRAPAAIGQAALERHIEHGAVDAGLAAGNQLHRPLLPSLFGCFPERKPRGLFLASFCAYIAWCRRKSAMAINGRRNKPFGPGEIGRA